MRQTLAVQEPPRFSSSHPQKPAAQRQTVLVVDGSGESQVHAVPPLLLSGCECVTAANVRTALEHLDHIRPSMTLVDARLFDTFPGEDPLERLRNHPSQARAPLVLLADPETPTEQVEGAWRAGATDCLLRPLTLSQVQERVAVLSGAPQPLERRAARIVLLVDEDLGFREQLERVLLLSGYRLLLASNEDEAATRAAAYRGPVDVVLWRGTRGAHDAAALARLRKVESLSAARGLLLVPEHSLTPGGLDAHVELMDLEHGTPREVCEHLERMLQRGTKDLRAHEAIPFFCPVQYRELGPGERWHPCYSQDVSPGGIVLRTLAPARVGAALELRIFLTTTGEVLEGSGVVTWANRWAPGSGLVAPTGMGLQFLGMSPKRLGRLRELCAASLF
ncbi:MAG TPA: PilZ domain-containing protein [Archangium sp.]|nr:PilZ domain-containing protein [Archangium sp.]